MFNVESASAASACACTTGACSVGIRTNVCGSASVPSDAASAFPLPGIFVALAVEEKKSKVNRMCY